MKTNLKLFTSVGASRSGKSLHFCSSCLTGTNPPGEVSLGEYDICLINAFERGTFDSFLKGSMSDLFFLDRSKICLLE